MHHPRQSKHHTQTSSAHKPKASKGIAQSSQNSTSPAKRLLTTLIKIAAGTLTVVATVITVVTGFLALNTHVSVVSTGITYKNNLLGTPFIVENQGPFGISDVSFSCLITKLKTSRNARMEDIQSNWGDNGNTPRMNVGERSTGQCLSPFGFPDPVETADITVNVGYKSDYWHWRQNRQFRFVTWSDLNNTLIWLPKSIGEPDFIQEK